MSNTCNAPGCRNDRRYKERYIVMPHVTELKLYGPRPDEYQKWQSKLERADSYIVSSATKICSNHFRYGKPLEGSRVPTLYMRRYPEWALSKQEAIEKAAAVSDDIICEILAHMCQYLPPTVACTIGRNYFMTDFDVKTAVQNLCQSILSMGKSKARSIVKPVAAYVMNGKVLEAVAIYKNGILFDNVNILSSTPMKQKNDCNDNHQTQHDNMECRPCCVDDFHQYSLSSKNTVSCTVHVENCEAVEQPLQRKCPRPTCQRKIQDLEKKIKELSEKVEHLEANNEALQCENKSLLEQVTDSRKERSELKEQISQPRVSIDKIRDDDQLITLHTGLPSYSLFRWVYNEVLPVAQNMTYWKGAKSGEKNAKTLVKPKRGPQRLLSMENELLMTLMLLKLNMSEEYLAHLFNSSVSLVSSVISTWIPMLAKELSGLLYWPTRQEVVRCYPDCFKKWTGITAILDCFEVVTEKPSHVDANSQIFSSYKNRPTVKFLLACTPGGSVSFISQPAGGNMSDKELVGLSGILQKFSPGDKCMADKGFRIMGELLECGVELVLPPFVKDKKPFTDEDNEMNKCITHARIHVERVIGRVRDYEYLKGVIPLTQLDLVGPAAEVCCALTNLKTSVVPNKD